jgi:phosphopantothenoylcysteine decarboxylase/phosphopantothenate--cysteine ligase
MNTSMYLHPETQNSIEHLKNLGLKILDTESGVLACGENGWGRLLDPELIFSVVASSMSSTQFNSETQKNSSIELISFNKLKKVNILILAGGTSEPIDTVRSITNTSTGQTGAELADQFYQLGYEVKLITSKRAHLPKSILPVETYTTYSDLKSLVLNDKNKIFDVIINLAAISDFSVNKIFKFNTITKSSQILDVNLKMSSELNDNESIHIELKKNPKLIELIRSQFRQAYLIGFKLTSDHSIEAQDKSSMLTLELQSAKSLPNSVLKVFQSGADAVVHNDIHDIQNNKRWFKIYNKAQTLDEQKYQACEFCASIIELAQALNQKFIKHFNLKKETNI